nr:ribonuclease H-like domain-containing protein [Tanacetum cinerariifolium]
MEWKLLILLTPMKIEDKLDLDNNGTLVDATKYRSMIVALMYLTSSRPDIDSNNSGFELTGFSDADYTGCKDTFKITSGGTQFLGDDKNATNPPPVPPIPQAPHTISTIKLLILKKGKYDIWAMKMEHYLAHTDYPIWERERDRKARTTLLMPISEDHLAKFHKITDAKEMWEAIKSRFNGNDESKKMHKYILKQQFEGFSVSNSEGLHKGYDRFQSLLSQLEIHGAGVFTEDANQKFLMSLPFSWFQVSLIMRTKPGVDTLSFDDLYNNLRVFEFDVKDHEDLEQVDEFDPKEMDLKWQVAMIFTRLKKSKGNQESRRRDAGNTGYKARDNGRRPAKQDEHKAMVTIDREGVDWTGHAEDDTKNYALMAFNSSNSGSNTKDNPHQTLKGKGIVNSGCSRFIWVFFLRTEDESSGILEDFIRQIENQLNQKVKTIRCDNDTKVKNKDIIEFYASKGIKREYSNARTPQQNGVTERKNRTLIEAARTMLAYLFLPNTFWAKAVSTACYVLNRVLATKPQNKTPYELITGAARASSTNYVNTTSTPVNTASTPVNTTSPLRYVNAGGPSYLGSTLFILQLKFLKIQHQQFRQGAKLNPRRYLKHLKMKVRLMLCRKSCCNSRLGKFGFWLTYLLGRSQEEGIDYDDVFAPLAKIKAIRIFLAFSSYMGFIVYQIDVKSAFLYGKIDEEVYVSQPLGFIDPNFLKKVYKVVKALYGLHKILELGMLLYLLSWCKVDTEEDS